MVSAADVAAMIAKARVDRKPEQALLAQSMIRLDQYNVSLESRTAVANAASAYLKWWLRNEATFVRRPARSFSGVPPSAAAGDKIGSFGSK